MVRYKNRYVTCEINFASKPKGPLEAKELGKEIQKIVQIVHGDFGCAAIRPGLSVTYCNESTRIAIIRARLGAHKLITSAIPFLTKIGKERANVRMLYVGGTLRHCYKRILIHQKAELARILPTLTTEAEATELKKSLLTLGGFFANYRQIV